MLRPALLAWLLSAVAPAHAGVVVDRLPSVGATDWGNYLNNTDQNLLVRFTLAETSAITGFDIVTIVSGARLGAPVRVKVRVDQAGAPALTNLFSFADTIDVVTPLGTSRVIGTNFAPITLTAGNYWFGVSSDTSESIGWSALNRNGSAVRTDQRTLAGDTILGNSTSIHTLGWRIRDDAFVVSAVPEPATWAMLVLGFGAVGGALRSRRRAAAGRSVA